VLKGLVISRLYSTAERLVWSDAESFNSRPFVYATEPSIVEEPLIFLPPRTTTFLIGKVYVFLTRPGRNRPILLPMAYVVRPVETTGEHPSW
jgi:hypothetical protein